MSSEESGQDDSEDKNEYTCIVVKSLSWRSPLVYKFLESLDEKVKKNKSSQLLRQMKRWVVVATSSEVAKFVGHFQKGFSMIKKAYTQTELRTVT